MNCENFAIRIDDFVDGSVEGAERSAAEAHIAECPACARQVGQARRLREHLRALARRDVPVRDAGYFSQAIARAAADGSRHLRYRYWLRGFGSAIAAGAAIFAVTLMFLQPPQGIDTDPGMPTVAMTLEEVRTVNLVFASAQALDDATLTVTLPDGVEIYGFEGQREITWMTSLSEGRNVLPLRLIATTPVGGELLATLRHEGDDRTFRLKVEVS
jgi:anti-sigma factor RsiW